MADLDGGTPDLLVEEDMEAVDTKEAGMTGIALVTVALHLLQTVDGANIKV
jgi:hypothetical protein